MEPQDQTDHIAILSLMMVGVLTKRLNELEQLDEPTNRHLRQLVKAVREHARFSGVDDLNTLFDKLDKDLG